MKAHKLQRFNLMSLRLIFVRTCELDFLSASMPGYTPLGCVCVKFHVFHRRRTGLLATCFTHHCFVGTVSAVDNRYRERSPVPARLCCAAWNSTRHLQYPTFWIHTHTRKTGGSKWCGQMLLIPGAFMKLDFNCAQPFFSSATTTN